MYFVLLIKLSYKLLFEIDEKPTWVPYFLCGMVYVFLHSVNDKTRIQT